MSKVNYVYASSLTYIGWFAHFFQVLIWLCRRRPEVSARAEAADEVGYALQDTVCVGEVAVGRMILLMGAGRQLKRVVVWSGAVGRSIEREIFSSLMMMFAAGKLAHYGSLTTYISTADVRRLQKFMIVILLTGTSWPYWTAFWAYKKSRGGKGVIWKSLKYWKLKWDTTVYSDAAWKPRGMLIAPEGDWRRWLLLNCRHDETKQKQNSFKIVLILLCFGFISLCGHFSITAVLINIYTFDVNWQWLMSEKARSL